jgi:dCTP deaminase
MLGGSAIIKLLESAIPEERLLIAPKVDLEEQRASGAASIDLRLGTWFVSTKLTKHHLLDVYPHDDSPPPEQNITNKHYIPFGGKFILHPRSFVLAATLEWLRMPSKFAGYVSGKSSWGRRGLVIETAPGVHPGFSGCLTLELANVGEIPIALMPGTKICQLFLHRLEGDTYVADQTSFLAERQPVLGKIKVDKFARNLVAGRSS